MFANIATVHLPLTQRRDMNLQDYVKYLLCVVAAYLSTALSYSTGDLAKGSRTGRGIFDRLFSGFRSCGGCSCGRSNRAGRFLGGEITKSHEFPWIANIHIKSTSQVGGVLINDRYVLTAASQIVSVTASEIKVTLGAYDRCNIDISSSNVSVEHIIMHPEFVSETHAHDLALLRLNRATSFEKRILPICLPNPGSKYLGQVGTLLGWTESKTGNGNSCLPKKIGLPILDRAECLKSGVETSHYHDDSGCIGVLGIQSNVCDNDVGTSVSYRSYDGIYDLVGLLSDGNVCDGVSKKTAVYTGIGPHLDWILQTTEDACYCTK